MKRLVVVAAVALSLAVPASVNAAGSYVFHHYNGKRVGDFKEAHPQHLGLCMDSSCAGYWLLRSIHWHNWGHQRTNARGKLASAALDGTPARLKLRHKQQFHNCFKHGDTVHFYTRAKIHIRGEGHHWRSIPHSTLIPKCRR